MVHRPCHDIARMYSGVRAIYVARSDPASAVAACAISTDLEWRVCTRALCNRPFGEDSRGCGRGVISRGERPACALHACGAYKRWRPFCGPELVAQRHHHALLLRHSSLTNLHLALAHSLTCILWLYIAHLHFYALFFYSHDPDERFTC